MLNISLRVDDALVEAIDEHRAEDVSRSKWLRRAAREKIDRPEPDEQIVELQDDLAEVEDDLADLERRVADLEDESLLDRIFKPR